MKNLAVLAFIFFISPAYAQEAETENVPVSGAKIKFAELKHDFGDIEQGDVVNHVFEFENIGTEPVIISDVRTSCGCTAPEWPREPVVPGTKSSIKVVFNSRGKVGIQNKIITIMSNAVNNPARVKIITNVLVSDPNN